MSETDSTTGGDALKWLTLMTVNAAGLLGPVAPDGSLLTRIEDAVIAEAAALPPGVIDTDGKPTFVGQESFRDAVEAVKQGDPGADSGNWSFFVVVMDGDTSEIDADMMATFASLSARVRLFLVVAAHALGDDARAVFGQIAACNKGSVVVKLYDPIELQIVAELRSLNDSGAAAA